MSDIIEKVKIDEETKLVFNLTTEEVEITTAEGTETIAIKSLATFPDDMEVGTAVHKSVQEAQTLLRLIKTFPDKGELLNAIRRTRHPESEKASQKRVLLDTLEFIKGMSKVVDAAMLEIRPTGNIISFMVASGAIIPYTMNFQKRMAPMLDFIAGNNSDHKVSELIGKEKAVEVLTLGRQLLERFRIVTTHLEKVKKDLI